MQGAGSEEGRRAGKTAEKRVGRKPDCEEMSEGEVSPPAGGKQQVQRLGGGAVPGDCTEAGETVRGEQRRWRSLWLCDGSVPSRAHEPDLESQPCPVPVVRCWASFLPALCLSSFIC